MGEGSVYSLITELCRRLYDTEIAASQGWRPHAAQEREMWVRKLRIKSYSVLLKKTIVEEPSGQEEEFTAEEGKGGMCPVAQLVGRALVLRERGEMETGDRMSRMAAHVLECGMHNDPEFDRIFRFLLYLKDSVASKQDLEPRIFKFRQPRPYKVGSYLEVPPYEEPDFTPPIWLERMLEEPTAGVQPLEPAGGWPQRGLLGSGLRLLGRFVDMPNLEETYGEVHPYNLPDLPPPRLLEPRGLTVPKLSSRSDPDEGYRSTSKGTSCASPIALDQTGQAVAGTVICSDANPDRVQQVSDDALWKAASNYRIPRLRTWETLGERLVDHEPPFLTEAGEEAAVKLWEFQSTETDPPFQKVSHKELMNGLYHVLLGEPSHFFRYNKDADELQMTHSLVVAGLSPGSVAEYCQPFVEAGTCYRRLRDRCHPDILLCSSPLRTEHLIRRRQGLVTQALWGNISTVLQFYQGAVLLMPVKDSMLSVKHWACGLIEKIKVVAKLSCVAPSLQSTPEQVQASLQSLPTGAKLVTHIYTHLVQDIQPDIRCLHFSALKACAGIYFRFIERWVFEGSLRDEFGEFFVQPVRVANPVPSRWEWSCSYQLLKKLVPGFLVGLEEAILLCGKTVNLLRTCCPKSALCVALQSGHPSVPCCLSSAEVCVLEKECRAFEERVHQVAGGPPKPPSELWAAHRPGALLRGREAELQAAREQHLLRLQEEHAAAVRVEAERRLEQQKDLLRQMEEVRAWRKEAVHREQAEERAALEYMEQQQRHQQQLEAEERERVTSYYKALGEQVEQRHRRTQWRLDRLRLAPHRRKLLEAELADEVLPTASLSSRPGSLALPSGPAGEPGHVVPDLGGHAAGDSSLAPTASPNNNSDTATENLPADNNHLISSDTRDENKNMAAAGDLDGHCKLTQVLPHMPTVEDAALGNVVPLRPLAVNRAKMLHEEFALYDTTESTDTNAWPHRLLSEEAARNRRRVLEEFGLTPAPEIMQTSRNNQNLQEAAATLVNAEANDTAAVERLRNRWNALHGDVNTLTGAAHFPAAEVHTPSSAASPEDSPMPPLKLSMPSAPSCSSLDLGSGQLSLETPTPSSSDGCTSLDSFKTGHSDPLTAGPVPIIPFWRSNRLSLRAAEGMDRDEVMLPQESEEEKTAEKYACSESSEQQREEEVKDEEREPVEAPREDTSPSKQQKQEKEDNSLMDDIQSDCTLIAVALQKSVMLPVWTQLRLANQAVLRYFFVELRLYRHFLALRDYLLLMDGEFGCSLSCALFTRAANTRSAGDLLNFATLNAVLRGALQASLRGGDAGDGDADDPASRLSFQLASAAPEQIDLANPAALQCLALRYRIDWPLCVVITDHALARYNEAFGFLLALRRAAWALEDCFHQLKVHQGKGQHAPKLHRIMVWRHEMMQFVNAVQSYITCSALTSSWEDLERHLGDVTTVDDLYKCHVDYLKVVLKRCFLYRNNKKVHEYLMKALQKVLVFHQEVLAAHWDMNVLSRRHEEYRYAAIYVFRLLNKMASGGTVLSVVELVEMLDANGHYTRLSKTLKTVRTVAVPH